MENGKFSDFEKKQQQILKSFKNIGISDELGTPHLQKDNGQLIIPAKPNQKKQILK